MGKPDGLLATSQTRIRDVAGANTLSSTSELAHRTETGTEAERVGPHRRVPHWHCRPSCSVRHRSKQAVCTSLRDTPAQVEERGIRFDCWPVNCICRPKSQR